MTEVKRLLPWDGVGMALSAMCALHCLAMPFVFAALPSLGAEWLAGERIHQWLAGGTFLVGTAAFVPGVCLHRRWTVPAIGGLGLILLIAGASGEECCAPVFTAATASETEHACCAADAGVCPSAGPGIGPGPATAIALVSRFAPPGMVPWLTPAGGLLMVLAHFMNGACCRRCRRQREALTGHAAVPPPTVDLKVW